MTISDELFEARLVHSSLAGSRSGIADAAHALIRESGQLFAQGLDERAKGYRAAGNWVLDKLFDSAREQADAAYKRVQEIEEAIACDEKKQDEEEG